jgi:crotonobetainyl-CoA:carnitine CoA-transferase CaiB-like acyl-CoA transferase
MTEALSHLTVIDASNGIAGQYCSKLLSDYGADTVLLEPPEGTPTRRTGPFSRDGDSLLHRHLNLGKRTSGAPLADLAAGADIALLPVGSEHAALRAANPRLITCTLSDFGEDGPRRDWKGGEMVMQALSGVMYRNGDPKREPLYGVGWRAYCVTGTAACSAVVAAVIARTRTGRGQHIAIDVAECAASMTYALATQYNYNGIVEKRSMPSNLPSAQLRCADAWVTVFIYDYRWADACHALGVPEMADDPRFRVVEDRMQHWPEAVEQLRKGVALLPAEEVVARLQKLKCVAGVAARPSQLGRSPHLAARDYWETADTPNGPRPALGAPFRMEKTPRRRLCAAAETKRQAG